MASPDDVYRALEALQLNLLENDWAASICRANFTIRPEELPIEYSENFSPLNVTETLDILVSCSDVIKSWLSSDTSSRAEGSATIANWSALSDVSYEKLLALLYYYITHDVSNVEEKSCIKLAIRSAQLYFNLISIPGSNVYKIFQVAILDKCLTLFGLYKCLNKIYSVDRSMPRSILKALNSLLISFKSFLQIFSLKNQSEAMELTLTAISDLSRCERFVSLEEFLTSNDKSTFTPLSRNAFLTLNDLCSGFHGRNVDRRVLYYLMPNFSLQGGLSYPEIAKWPQKEHTCMRRIALWFLQNHIITKGEESLKNVRILVQHLCNSTIDRADYRPKLADLLISIMSLFPEKNYFAILKWIFKEAFHDLVSQRMLSLELLSKLIFLKQGTVERSNMAVDSGHSTLTNSSNSHSEPSQPNSIEVTNPQSSQSYNEITSEGHSDANYSVGQARIISFSKPIEYVPIEFRRMMLAIIINRCQDSSAMVRSKAFSVLNEIISNQTSPTITKLVRSIFVDPYALVNEIKFDEEENDFLSCDEFREALDKPNWDGIQETIMPGGTKLHDLILKKCSDEKVLVRKAALVLLSHIYKLNINWLSKATLSHFGQHCRDPALSIRKEMQNLITDLMIFYPQHNELTRMWVQGVVPLVGDTDPVVSKTAYNLLVKMILVNIKPLDKTRTTTDYLPWNLITHIAALKNRVFLKKACHYWKEQFEPELSNSKIESIMTHIGSQQNGPCWVMLACYSEYNDIKRPEPILDYYMNVVAKGQGSFSVSHLVLRTINNCCHVLPREKQVHLENELVNSLQNQTASVWLVQSIVSVRANLRSLLAENPETAKRDLAKWTVEMAEVCEKRIELCLSPANEANESCLFHLSLLASLVDLHPSQISHSTVECISKFINSKEQPDLEHIKLQTLAIVAMGRIAFKFMPTASNFVYCLTSLVKECVNSSILNNVIITLADIGERFPNLIDNFIPSLMQCLKHRSRNVRKIALEIIVELLQEDYVKPKGAVLFNLMTLIHDPVRQTSATVKSYLANCYLQKLDKCFYGSTILQSMFYYNSYQGHHTYKPSSTSKHDAAFNFSGPKMHGKRLAIYRFVLTRIPSSDRYKCLTTVAEGVLKDVQQGNINVNILAGQQIVLDTFGLILTKNIITEEASKKKDEEEDVGGTEDVAPTENSPDLKTAFITLIINHCCNVRQRFYKHRMLHHRLYFFVRELVRERKTTINDFFEDDTAFREAINHEIETIPKQDWNENLEEKTSNEETPEKTGEDPTRKRKSDEHLSNQELRKKPKSNDMEVQSDGESNEAGQNVEVNDKANPADKSGNAEEIPSSNSNDIQISKEMSSVTNSLDALKLKQASVRLVRIPEGQQPTGSNANIPGKKGKAQEKSVEKLKVGNTGKKRTVRSSSDSLEGSTNLGIMLPPMLPSRTSRRAASTPTAPSRNPVPPLFSSTPLVTKPNGFNSTDISPVVQNNSCDEEDS